MQFTEETATVSHVEGEYVFLKTQNNASCSNCVSKTGCGNISSLFTLKPKNKLKINNTLGLNAGDKVLVGMEADKLLIATVLMYLMPLVSLFVFALIAKSAMGEIASIFAGVGGLVLGLLVVKQVTKLESVVDHFQPKLLRKIISVELV